MICPRCGTSNPEDAVRCSECNAGLTEGPSQPADDGAKWVEEAVILETTDETRLMAARSLLEAEGIPCYARGEEGQTLIGAGPVRLCVPVSREAAARALLAGSSSGRPEPR